MSRIILRRPDIESDYGIPHSTQYRLTEDGLFPTSVPLGLRAVGWLEVEVKAVLSARAAGRSDEEIRKLVEDLKTARKAAECEAMLAAGLSPDPNAKKQSLPSSMTPPENRNRRGWREV